MVMGPISPSHEKNHHVDSGRQFHGPAQSSASPPGAGASLSASPRGQMSSPRCHCLFFLSISHLALFLPNPLLPRSYFLSVSSPETTTLLSNRFPPKDSWGSESRARVLPHPFPLALRCVRPAPRSPGPRPPANALSLRVSFSSHLCENCGLFLSF